jgi:hypothetical protein
MALDEIKDKTDASFKVAPDLKTKAAEWATHRAKGNSYSRRSDAGG